MVFLVILGLLKFVKMSPTLPLGECGDGIPTLPLGACSGGSEDPRLPRSPRTVPFHSHQLLQELCGGSASVEISPNGECGERPATLPKRGV